MMELPLSKVVHEAASGIGPLPRPLQATLNITTRCNSHCAYCSFGDPAFRHSPDPSFERLTLLLRDLASFGVRSLSLSGGEPFLRTDLPEIVRTATALGMAVTVVTNGTLLSIARADQLAAAGLQTLVLSLDTLEQELYLLLRGVPVHGPATGFQALQMYRRTTPSIPRVVVNAVLTRMNSASLLEHFAALLPFLLPDDALMVQAYQPPSRDQARASGLRFRSEDLEELEALCNALIERKSTGWPIGNAPEFLRRLPGFLAQGRLPGDYECLTAYSSLYIKETLEVHPCWQFPSVGNLSVTPVAELWQSQAFDEARQRMRRLECCKCALVCHSPDFMDNLACLVGYEPFPR